ncbi:hypothetical protein ABKN59_011874 [Abortiporus biennis]
MLNRAHQSQIQQRSARCIKHANQGFFCSRRQEGLGHRTSIIITVVVSRRSNLQPNTPFNQLQYVTDIAPGDKTGVPLRFIQRPSRSSSKRPLVEMPTNPPEGRRLPPELIIEILCYLRNDFPTLGQCCLVASSWLDISRQYLYYNAVFSVPSQYKNFSSAYHYLEKSEEPSKKPAICDHILGAILMKLPNLIYLKMEKVRFVHTPSPPPARWSLKHPLNSASHGENDAEKCDGDAETLDSACAFKHLHQQTSSTENSRDLQPSFQLALSAIGAEGDQAFSYREILRLFPSYSAFDLSSLRNALNNFKTESSHRVELTAQQELLWGFILEFECITVIFNSTQASYGTMSFLRLGLETLERFQNAVRFLSRVNPDLEHFSIDPTAMFEDPLTIENAIDWNQLNLCRFTSLKSIFFDIDYANLITYQPDAALDGRAYLLCSYPSALVSALPRSIEDVIFGIRLRDEDVDNFINFVQWDILQAALLRLPKLKEVDFEMIQWYPQPGPLETRRKLGIREKLPLLSRRRVLKVADEPLSNSEERSLS